MKKYSIYMGIFLMAVVCPGSSHAACVRTLIHINSTASEGGYRLDEIARAAHKAGFNAVIFTDRDVMRWEYGIWPLRGLIRKVVEHPSIRLYGARRYLAEIKALHAVYPEMVFVPGTESAPFYYWEGNPLQGTLTMHDWHRHLIAIGMQTPQDYENIPVIGNPKALRGPFDARTLWPLLLVIAGMACMRVRWCNYRDASGRQLAPPVPVCVITGWCLCAAGIVLTVHNYPYRAVVYDAYHGSRGAAPYQRYIDYAVGRGGLVYWVHPDAEYTLSKQGVRFVTHPYEHVLRTTQRYTGFEVFYEGYNAAQPGGIWDAVLKEYCAGIRPTPLWAIAGAAFDDVSGLEQIIADTQTVVWADEATGAGITRALSAGKNYSVQGSRGFDFSLDEFKVVSGNFQAESGGTCVISEGPQVVVSGMAADTMPEVSVTIIKSGEIMYAQKHTVPFSIQWQDTTGVAGMSYYRVEIQGKDVHVITNPIFIKRRL